MSGKNTQMRWFPWQCQDAVLSRTASRPQSQQSHAKNKSPSNPPQTTRLRNQLHMPNPGFFGVPAVTKKDPGLNAGARHRNDTGAGLPHIGWSWPRSLERPFAGSKFLFQPPKNFEFLKDCLELSLHHCC